ncbi:hypothetical protein MCI89_09540 [Muricomes sp. OA1]|uniref:Uncharacterized protein n=1 Tax=Hungatella hathewayi TaxID=154046 RepID=A0A3E2WBB1_9FIRM|nr:MULTISPECIES: hypothetical protein [Clostridia]MCH1972581.1 hypothetical protein [Muricomes sp. OA1]RGC22797.1 hypothetical protein DWX41_22770 [Hungatella hathewayi]
MPKIDLTITISVIVALCAIVSPIATAIINNRYQLSLKKIDMEQKHLESTILYRKSIFENYLKYAGRCISHADPNALKDYGEYYLLALLYAPSELHSEMKCINALMLEYKWSQATPLFEILTPKINGLLQIL